MPYLECSIVEGGGAAAEGVITAAEAGATTIGVAGVAA